MFSIEEETIRSDLEAMVLRRNYKSAKSNLNTAASEKYMGKEVEHC